MLHLASGMDRLGTETAFDVLARAAALQAQGRDIISLGIGQPDFKTPPHIVEAAIKAMRDGHHGYTPANGIPALRQAVAKDLARRHAVEVNPDHVVIMPGGKPTMFFAILMFGAPGTEIIYPGSRLPDLSLDDRVHRRQAGADGAAGKERLLVQRRRGAGADHAEDAADHHQQSRQSDRRRGAGGRDQEARRRPGQASRRRDHVGRDLQPDAVRRPRAHDAS